MTKFSDSLGGSHDSQSKDQDAVGMGRWVNIYSMRCGESSIEASGRGGGLVAASCRMGRDGGKDGWRDARLLGLPLWMNAGQHTYKLHNTRE